MTGAVDRREQEAAALAGPGDLYRATRLATVILLVLAAANGVWLYLVPGQAEFDYAWSIKPSVCAAFIGAGFLAGTVATALVVFSMRAWRSVRVLALPLIVLSLFLIGATIVHQDRFKWGYVPTWVWAGVYTIVPFGVAYAWWVQDRAEPDTGPAHRGLREIRLASAVLGGLTVATGLWLVLAPASAGETWPWPLTPLLARATGAWYLMVGTAQLVGAATLNRPHEVVVPYATLLVWSALLLLLPALYADQMVRTGAPLVAFLAGHAALVALGAFALLRAGPLMRGEGERL